MQWTVNKWRCDAVSGPRTSKLGLNGLRQLRTLHDTVQRRLRSEYGVKVRHILHEYQHLILCQDEILTTGLDTLGLNGG